MNNQNIWQLDEPIATNLQELTDLANHYEDLKNKKVTLIRFTIDEDHYNDDFFNNLDNIIRNGHPKIICFYKCKIESMFCQLIVDQGFLGTKLAINDCGLDSFLGERILDSLDPYSPIEIDLSNNKLGNSDCSRFIYYIKNVIKCHLAGFKSIDLSNNSFTSDIINDLKNFGEKYHFPIIL